MAQPHATGPYVWVTWLPRLLSGESSCEWASWFKSQHEGWSWSSMPSDFDQVDWLTNYTALLNRQRQRREEQDYTILTEGQHSFNFRSRDVVNVIDAKIGYKVPPTQPMTRIFLTYPRTMTLTDCC